MLYGGRIEYYIMASTKTSKYIVMPIDKMQRIDQIASRGEMKFSAALEVIVDYGLKEYDRRMGAATGGLSPSAPIENPSP